MNEIDRNLVMEIAASVSRPIELADDFLHEWIFDAGYDFEGTGLTFNDLKNVWNGATTGVDWHSIGFVAGEQLAFYAANPVSSGNIPRWVFAALLARDAVENKHSDWEFHEGYIAELLDKSGQITCQQKQQIIRISPFQNSQ